jgi:N-acetylgalactosamine kinase
MKNEIVSVILAAGKGTRMRSPLLHKVCHTIEDQTVIERSIKTYTQCGIKTHFIVVGQMIEQVMQAASLSGGHILFCHQPEQRGTGNAAKAAARMLKNLNYRGDILVVAGDKVIDTGALARLIHTFNQTRADLAFIVGRKKYFASSGRIMYGENGEPEAIVEVFDISRFKLIQKLKELTANGPVSAERLQQTAFQYFKVEKKASLALGPLWDAVRKGEKTTSDILEKHFPGIDNRLHVNNLSYTAEQLHQSEWANLSVYLFKAPALYKAVEKIYSDNAQKEEYLTDIVYHLSHTNARIITIPIDHSHQVMAFNTPEELDQIKTILNDKKEIKVPHKVQSLKTADNWLKAFEKNSRESTLYLKNTYDERYLDINEKRSLIISLLQKYIKDFGNTEVVISRSPGRVNIMGRHIDHQGGYGNMIAIDREVFAVMGNRSDRQIHLHHLFPSAFPDQCFSIDEIIEGFSQNRWIEFVDSPAVAAHLENMPGHWSNYIRAAFGRFQAHFSNKRLKGANIVVAGNIPMAAGLSSSSALLVAIAEGLLHLNQLPVEPQQFVELCGESEWYVGTRGGAGDHAAMKFAQKGAVVQVGFFPFRVTDRVAFPEDHVIVVCNSFKMARKTEDARDIFNQRIACYHIGREWIKKTYPQYAFKIEHLRDINTAHLGISTEKLLNMIKTLPLNAGRQFLRDNLEDRIKQYLQSHANTISNYPVRSVVLFGLSECERSRTCTELLRDNHIKLFGRWMNISHDGDRISRMHTDGSMTPYHISYSDAYINKLNRHQAEPGHANLVTISGSYGCSIEQLDEMVDICKNISGVAGAQMAGAGLGGCVMALVKKDAYPLMEAELIRSYYEPAGLEPEILTCYPVSGSGIIAL